MTETGKIQVEGLVDMGKILAANLMDDYYMRRFFEGDIPCIEYVLRVIMRNPTLVVKRVETQKFRKGPGHEVYLDIYAVDGNGVEYDIEVQQDNAGAHPKRARFNSAMLDTNQLKKNQPYTALKQTVVIFITEHDVLGDGLPLYRIERTINGKRPFNDGSLILYVNGEIKDPSTELGRLMHDFSCTSAEEMYSPLLAERTRLLKNTQEGQTIMSTAWKEALSEYGQQVTKQVTEQVTERMAEQFARRMLENGEALEKVSRYSSLSRAKVEAIARELAPAV